jgi:hypothetical protein
MHSALDCDSVKCAGNCLCMSIIRVLHSSVEYLFDDSES